MRSAEAGAKAARAIPAVADEVKDVIDHVGEALSEEVEVIEDHLADATEGLGVGTRIAIGVGAALALITGLSWWVVGRRRTRARRIWQERGSALQRMWRHPELVARPAERSILSRAGKNLAVAAITTAGKRGGLRLIEKAWPD